jgi:DNA-binding response OmpR family regulator
MTHVRTVLVVDGDNTMRETLREQLTRDQAFAVTEAASAREAEASLFNGGRSFAAVIMDAALPDGDGHDVCARLRASGLSMPVILLNGANRVSPADDTITIAKPFRLSELMTRLHARLGLDRIAPATSATISIGRFSLRADEKALLAPDGARIRLTEKETAILTFLHGKNGQPVSRAELLRDVWGYNPAVTTHTLETHIYRLRRKIEADPAKAALLLTDAGGYRLVRD